LTNEVTEKKLSFYFATFSISSFLESTNSLVVGGVIAVRKDHDCGSSERGTVRRKVSWCAHHTDAAVVLGAVAMVMA
jgi:hypothetical protein